MLIGSFRSCEYLQDTQMQYFQLVWMVSYIVTAVGLCCSAAKGVLASKTVDKHYDLSIIVHKSKTFFTARIPSLL